jgi:hypothetical protein
VGEWSIRGSGGTYTLEMPLSVRQAQERLAIESTLDTCARGWTGLGVREAVVQPSGRTGCWSSSPAWRIRTA